MKKSLIAMMSIMLGLGAMLLGEQATKVSAGTDVPYYDPAKSYTESTNYCEKGDFESFEENYKMKSDTKDQGGMGTVSLDNPATIVTKDGSKCARLGRMTQEDSKEYSSLFYLIPTVFEEGNFIRISYDVKFELSCPRSTYPTLNAGLVGSANMNYYNMKLKYDDVLWPPKTNGKEGADHYVDIYRTEKQNGWMNFQMNVGICTDIAYWDSLRFLIVSLNYGDCMYIDNIKVTKLVEGTVKKPLTSISIKEGDIDLTVGQEKQLTIVENPTDHDPVVYSWSSSNTGVATVENGKVKAVGEGAAEITVLADNGLKTSIVVVVSAAKGGCGGSVIASSFLISTLALCGCLYLNKKRKQ